MKMTEETGSPLVEAADEVTLDSMPKLTRADVEKAHIEKLAKLAVDNQWPHPSGKDWLLAHLVDLANRGVSVGVTLTIGGSNITGSLIGGETYLNEMASSMERSTSSIEDAGETQKALAEFFLSWRHVYAIPEDAPENYQFPPPAYIHLKNARRIAPNGSVPKRGMLWRGRLSCVDGFALGEITFS